MDRVRATRVMLNLNRVVQLMASQVYDSVGFIITLDKFTMFNNEDFVFIE